MVVRCPDCGTELLELHPEREMGSSPARYLCGFCEVTFERDAASALLEVEG